MREPAPCQACQVRAGRTEHDLVTLETTSPNTGAITLCSPCFARRQTKVWDLSTPMGKKVRSEVQQPARRPTGRYSYLVEEDRYLHLVRLNPDWVQRHRATA